MSQDKPASPLRCVTSRRSASLVTPCFGMAKALNDPYSKSGIVAKRFTNFDTERSRDVVVAFSGEFKKRPVCLNYCPFCGRKLYHTRGADK